MKRYYLEVEKKEFKDIARSKPRGMIKRAYSSEIVRKGLDAIGVLPENSEPSSERKSQHGSGTVSSRGSK